MLIPVRCYTFNPYFETFTPIYYYNGNTKSEIFTHLNYNGRILSEYYISSEGRIYNIITNQFLKYHYDKDGYVISSIVTNRHCMSRNNVRVHRIEMMSFFPVENYSSLSVNHKDGNKNNNSLMNLEWCTNMANTRHGWNKGLNKNCGSNHPNSKYSDQQIRDICRLIDDGKSNSEISQELFGFDQSTSKEKRSVMAIISDIRHGKVHRNISEQYRFMNNNIHFVPEERFIHILCRLLSDGNTYTYRELANILNIPNEERLGFVYFINNLIDGRTSMEISRLYGDMKRPINARDMDYLYN